MRLDFNLLWVDDQAQMVQAQKIKLEREVRKEGFKLQVEFASSVDAALLKLSTDIYGDNVDLILMDYDLGAGKKGDAGLVEIRQKMPYRDIVFYSSQANDLLRMVAAAKVQGIHCTTRNDLPDAAHGVFENLVKKVLDIDHSRGIVMGTTAEIDNFVNDSLSALFEGCSPEQKGAALELIKARVEKSRARFEAEANKINGVSHLSQLGEHYTVCTSVDRLEVLRKLLKQQSLFQERDTKLASYAQETIPKRNLLAHVRVKTDGFRRSLIDKKGHEHTSEKMKELRVELLAHHEAFDALLRDLINLEKK